ncbi:MAG: MGMT family protein [Candidatus Woesearchaeota archaeon]
MKISVNEKSKECKKELLEKIVKILKKIPKGKVSTYKSLGNYLNLSPRFVGKLLGMNKTNAPCYKIVRSNGEIGGYFNSTSKKMLSLKKRNLKREGIGVINNKIINFKERFIDIKDIMNDKQDRKKMETIRK